MATKLNLKELSKREDRLAPGHRLCAGCGAGIVVRQILAAIDEPVVLANATGCLEVSTSIFPYSSWRVPWIHNAFENAASTMSGVETAYRSLVKQGKIPEENVKFLAFGGDGGTYDIGIQALSGALERGHKMMYVCYNNEAYMNTGIQRSGATPYGAWTTTTPVKHFKKEIKKSIDDIVTAHKVPYQATASVAYPDDLYKKLIKAKEIRGFKFIHIIAPCPPGWKARPEDTVKLARLAVQTGIFPVFEVENGKFVQTVRTPNRKPVLEYLKLQGRFKHLKESDVADIQKMVDTRYAELEKRFQEK